MIYDVGSVIVTPFPFTDIKSSKRRPALVISEPDYQARTGHAAMLMITSAKHSDWPSDWKIERLKTTGLAKPSIVRQKIFTLDLRVVIRRTGCLATEDLWHVAKQFNKYFDSLLNLSRSQAKYQVHEPSANY